MERRDVKAIMLALAVCLVFLTSCATCPVSLPCPSKDVVFPVMTPIGSIAIQVDRDFFNEDNEGRSWVTLEDFLKGMEEDGKPDEQLLEEAGPGDGPA
jgi:hypothetical protein